MRELFGGFATFSLREIRRAYANTERHLRTLSLQIDECLVDQNMDNVVGPLLPTSVEVGVLEFPMP